MATQGTRFFEVITPLGPDVLLFRRMTGVERLGRLFQYELDLLSEDPELAPSDLLGQNVSVRVDLPDGSERFFNGFVTRFAQLGQHGNHAAYQATLHPWLWFLTRTADCRIFQNKKVPDIIKEVFGDNGFTDIEDSLSGNYREWEYCVQYRETDFNFVSRLMEQEGIYYRFKHEKEKHQIVFCDGYSSHEKTPSYETIPFFPPTEDNRRERDHIYDWRLSQQVRTGAYVLNDFDFLKPKANLEVNYRNPKSHDKADNEIFDYPGEYLESGDGDNYVKARLEELLAQHELVEGTGNARGIECGSLFSLDQFPRQDQNREYLVIGANYEMQTNEYGTTSSDAETSYTCTFSAIESKTPFRAQRTTPKPVVQGPQTAIVVGKSGEEIFTDEYGRVKVQFHWDRYGKSDENSSCWVRVAQVWAGKNWGAMHIPRMGQEVIVEFLEGDPDRPIITGRVYNADQMPVYELPSNKTQSGVKSRSSKGGSGENFNEIRFEDKTGSEEMYIHAEKDQNTVVENDQGIAVGNDRGESIERDRSLKVGRDKSEKVDRNKSIHIVGSHDETIQGSMSQMVAMTKDETITLAKVLSIGGAYQVSVGAAMNQTVGGFKSEEVGGYRAEIVGVNSSETIGGNKSISTGGSLSVVVGANQTVQITKDLTEKVGGKHTNQVAKDYVVNAKKIQFMAEDQIVFKTGKAEIVMKKNGDVNIKGKKINVKGSGDVIIKGSKIKEN